MSAGKHGAPRPRRHTGEVDITRLGEYLAARRALVSPEDVGLVRGASRRVVPGLRREEVAILASISPEYYRRLERGVGGPPSDAILDSLARALGLSEHARLYMYRLARGHGAPASPSASDDTHTRRMLDSWSDQIAYALDQNQDVISATSMARAVLGESVAPGANRLIDTLAAAESAGPEHRPIFFAQVANFAAAMRYYADPEDERFRQILAAVGTNDEFSAIWARHDAHPLTVEPGLFWLDREGWIRHKYEVFEVPRSPGQVLIVWWFRAGCPSEKILQPLTTNALWRRDETR
ncbi:helix-turn-helix domain-containing protein [Microbacterium sp. P05]|uniref:MmyB family transcriptional regulator n=1 Tax=Microbacterium sp. P05 TaxID=3366948 RepID=UPI00374623E4